MTLHTDIHDLPMRVFVACIVDSDLSGLLIEGSATDADLMEAWSNLYAQYVDLLGDAETEYTLYLQRDIALLTHKITAIECALNILAIRHEDLVVIALKDFGIDTSQLYIGNHKYAQELKRISIQLARFRLELKEKENELAERDGDDKEPVTKAYFTKILSRLSKYQGYPLRINELTIGEFAAHLKEYNSQALKNNTKWQEGAA